jgi:glycine/D-amino acid oxidase-like deaminating enzyme/nitrite reductase/ring-hydroxylating ferredoxin subunit
VTAQHGLIYDELIRTLGDEKARLYYDANREALQFVRDTVRSLGIDCDWTEEDAYVYTAEEQNIQKIDREWQAYEKLGIPGRRADGVPLPVGARAAIVMPGQARFHPTAYLARLVSAFVENGGLVFEDTMGKTVEHGSPLSQVVTADGHRVSCRDAVSCSHFPFYGAGGFYFARMYVERSYALGVSRTKEYPGGMYLSADDPVRSIRSVSYNGEDLLIIGGERHKTGQGICTIRHYEALEAFTRETFGPADIRYRWSAQDYTTLDKVPYVGRPVKSERNAFIATGYRKWGMTTSAAAALLLKDLILGVDNRYEALYTPSRFHADPDVKTFLSLNADVAKHLVGGKLEWNRKEPEDVGPDEGAVVEYRGRRAGAYREPDGTLHLLDTTCTHMGCEVEWNEAERTWDCPCHGSRFTFRGEVLNGPAKKPLPRVRTEPT